jgi:hypothetical protein
MAKSDSVSAQVTAARQARQGGINWPADAVSALPDPVNQARAEAQFEAILAHRPPDLWRRADIIAAAHLAIAWNQQDRLTQQLEEQGFLIRGGKNGDGGLLQNPILNALQMTASRADSLARRLGLAGVAVDARQVSNAARTFQQAGGSTYAPPPAPSKPGEVIDWVAKARQEAKQ